MKIDDQNTLARIKKQIPTFNENEEIKPSHVKSLMKVVSILEDRRREQKSKKIRFSVIIKKALTPGVKVLVKGEELTIRSIGKTGYIQVEGRRGSFNPNWVDPV